MKHIKTYESFEDNSELIRNLFNFLITNYTINGDGIIDVDGSVDLSSKGLTSIPFKFGLVIGHFDISNNKLTSLEGCPKEVVADFDCSHNKLKDLIGGPQDVDRNYFCDNNELESLEGCAGDIKGRLVCRYNKLEMLDCSSVIFGDICCDGNNFKKEPEFFGVCGGKIKWK